MLIIKLWFQQCKLEQYSHAGNNNNPVFINILLLINIEHF